MTNSRGVTLAVRHCWVGNGAATLSALRHTELHPSQGAAGYSAGDLPLRAPPPTGISREHGLQSRADPANLRTGLREDLRARADVQAAPTARTLNNTLHTTGTQYCNSLTKHAKCNGRRPTIHLYNSGRNWRHMSEMRCSVHRKR